LVNIFCTKKLEGFVETKERTLESYTSDNNWNGQLISVDRRKCLFFVHKQTLYSILLLDILKKDLLNLDNLFFNCLIDQLKLDNLYKPQLDHHLKENYSTLNLFKTDNDQSTLSALRDGITRLNSSIEDEPDKIIAANKYLESRLNTIPLKMKKFHYAKEIMELELKNHISQ